MKKSVNAESQYGETEMEMLVYRIDDKVHWME